MIQQHWAGLGHGAAGSGPGPGPTAVASEPEDGLRLVTRRALDGRRRGNTVIHPGRHALPCEPTHPPTPIPRPAGPICLH